MIPAYNQGNGGAGLLMLTEQKLYTADDLWALQQQTEHHGKRYELSEGRLIEKSLNNGEQGEIAATLIGLAGAYVLGNNLGRIYSSETGFILSEGNYTESRTVRAPDAAFISYARFPADQPRARKFVPMAPDLAVEVVSPSDSAAEVGDKIFDYLRSGVALIWIVYPGTQTIHAHSQGRMNIFTADDTLDGGDVLPGFRIPVRDIFAP
jgi:Uma2 family endonuclease